MHILQLRNSLGENDPDPTVRFDRGIQTLELTKLSHLLHAEKNQILISSSSHRRHFRPCLLDLRHQKFVHVTQVRHTTLRLYSQFIGQALWMLNSIQPALGRLAEVELVSLSLCTYDQIAVFSPRFADFVNGNVESTARRSE